MITVGSKHCCWRNFAPVFAQLLAKEHVYADPAIPRNTCRFFYVLYISNVSRKVWKSLKSLTMRVRAMLFTIYVS